MSAIDGARDRTICVHSRSPTFCLAAKLCGPFQIETTAGLRFAVVSFFR